MAKSKIVWKENGWTTIQEVNAEKHIVAIDCLTENGKVVEVKIRHHDGEEEKAKVFCDGKPALPMSIDDFQNNFNANKLEMR